MFEISKFYFLKKKKRGQKSCVKKIEAEIQNFDTETEIQILVLAELGRVPTLLPF